MHMKKPDEHQASNILEMERRYESPLKQAVQAYQNGRYQSTRNMQLGINIAEHTRHNFYEIQNILHNEILLFKVDANSMVKEMD